MIDIQPSPIILIQSTREDRPAHHSSVSQTMRRSEGEQGGWTRLTGAHQKPDTILEILAQHITLVQRTLSVMLERRWDEV